jgi:exopolyphosphatase / guanosine-5'-triphosphate,3'-diphosphate pyrophosphatase
VRRRVEQYEGTGRPTERRERPEAAPEAGSAGREVQPARGVRRVAAVDLGTNSTRLLVADANGTLEEVVRRLEITRLGEGVDERHRLLPVPIARVRNVLSSYRRELESLGAERTLCIATSAVRDAENGEAFLGEIEWSYGFTTRLLSGDEEAEMTLRGIGALEPGTLVVDIGGGSTEVQVVGTDVRESLDIGCVRMTERFGEDVTAIREHVRGLLPPARPDRAVGVAGTVTTIAALDLGLAEYDAARIHGHTISRDAVAEQTARLASMSIEERARIIEPGRAPVIVAGAAILSEVLDLYELAAIEASERDILHGAALAAAELPAPEEGAAPPGAYTCC